MSENTREIPAASEEYEAFLPEGWAEGDDIFDVDSWTGGKAQADESEAGDDQEEDTGSEKESKKQDQTWTIMIYMCGTDLESEGECATFNLAEILEADLKDKRDKINILVETGGTSKWAINNYADEMQEFDGIDTDSLGYYKMVEDDIILEATRAAPRRARLKRPNRLHPWENRTHSGSLLPGAGKNSLRINICSYSGIMAAGP